MSSFIYRQLVYHTNSFLAFGVNCFYKINQKQLTVVKLRSKPDLFWNTDVINNWDNLLFFRKMKAAYAASKDSAESEEKSSPKSSEKKRKSETSSETSSAKKSKDNTKSIKDFFGKKPK